MNWHGEDAVIVVCLGFLAVVLLAGFIGLALLRSGAEPDEHEDHERRAG